MFFLWNPQHKRSAKCQHLIIFSVNDSKARMHKNCYVIFLCNVSSSNVCIAVEKTNPQKIKSNRKPLKNRAMVQTEISLDHVLLPHFRKLKAELSEDNWVLELSQCTSQLFCFRRKCIKNKTIKKCTWKVPNTYLNIFRYLYFKLS